MKVLIEFSCGDAALKTIPACLNSHLLKGGRLLFIISVVVFVLSRVEFYTAQREMSHLK